MEQIVINGDRRDFEDIMIMALRYALPRKTYVTGEVCDFIRKNKGYLTARVIEVMLRDIDMAINDGVITPNGIHSCDFVTFVHLADFLKNIQANLNE